MEHFKDNSGCSGKKKSEIFWNNSKKVQNVFAGVLRQVVSYAVWWNEPLLHLTTCFYITNNYQTEIPSEINYY